MTTPSNANQATGHTHTLVEQVQARRRELTSALSAKETSPSTRADIEAAIAALAPMLTGDLAKLPDMVSRDLIKWLDTSKYLGAHADAATPAGADSSPGISTASSPAIPVKSEDGGASSPGITVMPSSGT